MSRKQTSPRSTGSILLAGILAWCTAHADGSLNPLWLHDSGPQVAEAAAALEGVTAPAAVFVGEVHDQLPYHINQLAVITALHERGHKVAVGLEMVQAPFQQALDDFTNGHIDFEQMLSRTEYYSRWRYDIRHYEPIFAYAREHQLPLRALNAPTELTDRIREVGIDGLAPDERELLPDELTPLSPGYLERLENVFREHQESGSGDFQRFIDVQRGWDEVMAWQAADFLMSNRDHVLVVLAGTGHILNGYGIPRRVEKYAEVPVTVVLSHAEREWMPDSADLFLELAPVSLPAPGLMGVLIGSGDSGTVVDGFADDSPAALAGMQRGDLIVEINNQAIERFEDVRFALWDKRPGEVVNVTVVREGNTRLSLSFELR